MNSEFKKTITDKLYRLQIFFKSIITKKKHQSFNSMEELLNQFKDKNRIVVFCSGPSANKVEPFHENLYLATNDGYKFMVNNNLEYLFYLNDQYYLNKNLTVGNKYLKKDQKIIFYYSNTDLHNKGWNYLKDKLWMFGDKNFFSFNEMLSDDDISKSNFNQFNSFYKERGLPVKVQNSGMFLLLFGFYLAVKLNKPLDIYGLDLGVGGNVHYDKKGLVTKSITKDAVKKNVKMYLDYMYQNHFDIKNYSYFN